MKETSNNTKRTTTWSHLAIKRVVLLFGPLLHHWVNVPTIENKLRIVRLTAWSQNIVKHALLNEWVYFLIFITKGVKLTLVYIRKHHGVLYHSGISRKKTTCTYALTSSLWYQEYLETWFPGDYTYGLRIITIFRRHNHLSCIWVGKGARAMRTYKKEEKQENTLCTRARVFLAQFPWGRCFAHKFDCISWWQIVAAYMSTRRQ